MKIIDRYLLKEFFAPLGVSTLIFCVLVMLGRFFDKMSIFVRFHARLKDILVYLLLGLPFWLNLVLPVATMLALLFSLGQLQQRGELTALRGAGIPTWRLLLPFVAAGFALVVISMVGGLTFLPKLNFESRKVYRVEIKKRDVLEYRKDNLVTAGRDRRRFTIGSLDVEEGLMKEVIVDQFDDSFAWVETISAKSARYKDGKWIFEEGVLRSKDPSANMGVREQAFRDKWVAIAEKPSDFAVEDKEVDDMTLNELHQRIKRLRTRGAPVNRAKVAYHLRFALPFANLVVMALAIPFALRSGTQARTQNFTYAIGLAFLYWGLVSFCQSLGYQGHVPAWMAAWISNVVFAGLAAWKLSRITL